MRTETALDELLPAMQVLKTQSAYSGQAKLWPGTVSWKVKTVG